MNIMNSKPLAIFQAAMLGILLAQTDRAFGQAEERPTRAQLERIQRTFLIYIQDGENEYQNATNRHAHAIKLWQNNVAKAQFRLDETFTLMDGNQKLKGHQAQIGALRTFWGIGEARWVTNFTTNYLALRNRAYELQNKLNPLVNELDPAAKALLSDISKKIHDSDMPELVAHTNYDDVQNRDLSGKLFSTGSGSSGTTSATDPLAGFFSNPNNPSAMDAAKQALQSTPSDALSPEEAQQALEFYKSGNIPGLAALVQRHPGNEYLRQLLSKALINAGLTPADAANYVNAARNHDSGAMAQIAAKYPAIQPQASGTRYVTPSGGEFDIRPFLGEDGKLKPKTVVAKYTDIKFGQIDSEVIVDADYKTLEPGTVAVQTTEEPGSRIDWRFTIKQIKSAPAGQGFTVTFQLVNDGTPADAAFAVTAWEGPDGRKDSTDNQITVMFPKPGSYVIKASGSTTKYGSKFTISQPVNF